MNKTERFKIDVTGYQDAIRELCDENDDYSLKKADLLDQYDTDDRVFRYSTTDNHAKIVPDESDPKILRVIAFGGDCVGTVKKGSVSRVRNLLSSPEFVSLYLEMYGGDYKHITYDDDVIQNSDSEYYVDLFVTIRPAGQDPAPAAPASPAAPAKPEKRGFLSRLFSK